MNKKYNISSLIDQLPKAMTMDKIVSALKKGAGYPNGHSITIGLSNKSHPPTSPATAFGNTLASSM